MSPPVWQIVTPMTPANWCWQRHPGIEGTDGAAVRFEPRLFFGGDFHNQIAFHPAFILDSHPVQQGRNKIPKENGDPQVMKHKSPARPRLKKDSPLPRPAGPAITIQALKQPDLKTLSPLQRQRLDTAVMLLVNHLLSASSSR